MDIKRIITAIVLLGTCQTIYPWTFIYYLVHRHQSNLTKSDPTNKKSINKVSVIPELAIINRHIIDKPNNIDVHEKSFLAGTIFDFHHIGEKPWWLGIRTAFVKETSQVHGTSEFTISRAAFDDVFIQAGYNQILSDDWQLCIHGAMGLPTLLKLKKNELFNTLVGTRLFSLGLGTDLSYALINEKNRQLILNLHTRLLHFFTRDYTPILQCGGKFQAGNATDVFPSLVYTHNDHYLEFDYDLTIFTNVAVLAQKTTYIPVIYNHSPYIQYYYTIHLPRTTTTMTVGGGIEYSYAKVFNRKEFQMWWLLGATF